MRPKTVAILALLALVAVAGAAIALFIKGQDATPERVGEAVFPGLIDRVNEVSRIVIQHSDGTLTVERDGDRWTLAESDGYPVERQVAQRIVVDFTDMNYLAPKTRDADLYYRLDVQDPGREGAKSKSVHLLDDKGEVLAEAVVGKRRVVVPGELAGGIYIRLPEDPQAWLVSGGLTVETHPREWLTREVVDIKEERIAAVTVEHPDGDVVRIRRAPDAPHGFTMENVPEGKKLVFDGAPQYIARVLSHLAMEDVRKADNVDLDESKAIKATYVTTDGVRVRLTVEPRGSDNWTRVVAAPADDAAEPEKAAAAAKALNERLGGWIYNIANYRLADFKKGPDRLLEDAKPSG